MNGKTAEACSKRERPLFPPPIPPTPLVLCVWDTGACDESKIEGLRRWSTYQRFPELLLEQPDAAESAFRVLLLSGVAVRDADEWEEHDMTAVNARIICCP